jgi:hypothetical protein
MGSSSSPSRVRVLLPSSRSSNPRLSRKLATRSIMMCSNAVLHSFRATVQLLVKSVDLFFWTALLSEKTCTLSPYPNYSDLA